MAVKLVSGAGGGGKSGGGGGRAPEEAPDSLRSKQFARIIDLVSEGEINGLVDGFKSVYLDNVPIQNEDDSFNIKGISFDTRNGTQSQTHITGFPSVESENSVSTEVTYASSLTRSITNTDADVVRVTLSVPRLTIQDTSNGDISGTSVQVAIDVQDNGGGFVAQKLSKTTTPLSVDSSGILSSLTTEIINAQINVKWTGVGYAFQSISYSVQYRVVGATTWLALSTGSQSGTGRTRVVSTTTAFIFETVTTAPEGSKTTSFSPAVADSYEFRVVKNSGTGTLALSGTATTWAGFATISGKTSSRYQRSYDIPLTGSGPWDVRVRRLTADSVSQTLQNKTFWDNYTEIINEKFTYPNSALMAMSIDSSLFNKVPTRGFEIEGIILQVPSNYDALTRIYTGAWDGNFITAYSNNPAWIFYDLVTNSRYGLGDFVPAALVDKWTLFEIGQYCDELVDNGEGGEEPRFTVNAYLQTREEAIKILQSLSSAFAAMVYWSAGSVTLTQDSVKEPSALFTKANVVNGTFSYAGSSARTRSTVISVTWNDPDDLYRQAIEYVEDAVGIERFGFIKKDVAAFGCTSRGQAHRFGKAILFTERMETETVSFNTGLDGLNITPGEVFQTTDPVRSGSRLGGRLQAATASAFTLDSSVVIDGVSVYTLWAVMPDGTVESSTVTDGAGTTTTLNVSPAFSDVPQLQSVWVLGASNLNPEKWRVISISEDGVNAAITGLEYRADKYAAIESDIKLDPIPISNIRLIPTAPTSVTIEESLYLISKTLVGVRLTVSWLGDEGLRYNVEHKIGEDNWETFSTDASSIDIGPVLAGTHEIRITGVNGIGARSETVTASKAIFGLTEPPADVSTFQLQAVVGSAFLTWEASTDLDVLVGGKLLIRHTPDKLTPDWSSATDIGGSISGTTTAASLPLLSGSYLAKWVDSSGNKSVNETIISTNAPNILALNFVSTITEDPTFLGAKTDTAELDGKLTLDSVLKIGSMAGLMSTFPRFSALGGISSSGEYAFNDAIDLGSIQTSRITAIIKAAGVDVLDLISERDLCTLWSSVAGDVIDDVDATLFIRQSNDNIAFGAWEILTAGDYTARAFQFKVSLETAGITHNIRVSDLSVTVDMPDRIEAGDDIASGVTSKAIAYTTAFMGNPAIGITAQDMATGDFFSISSKTLSGFNIIFKNSAGTNINRTFDYIAKAF